MNQKTNKLKSVILITLSFILLSCSSSPLIQNHLSVEPSEVVNEQSIVALSKRSTFFIQVKDEAGEVISSGSGFLVDKNKVITNHHVIDTGITFHIFSYMGVYLSEATIINVDVDNDLALLYVDNLLNVNILPIMPDTTPLKYLDKVYAVGYPFGDSLTITTGSFQKKSRIFDIFNRVSISIAPGNSGGPCIKYNHINQRYEVIGVISANMSSGEHSYFNHGLIIPAEKVHALLERNR